MKKFLVIFLVLFAGITLSLFTACGSDDNYVPTNNNPTSSNYTVRYEISGPLTTATQILYRPFLDLQTIYDVPIPWQYTFVFSVSGNSPISTQCVVSLPFTNSEMYTVKIFVNGNEVASNTGDNVVGVAFVIIP